MLLEISKMFAFSVDFLKVQQKNYTIVTPSTWERPVQVELERKKLRDGIGA